MLKEAIELGGSSVSDYVDADGEEGFFQLQHRVYGREGEPCLVCGTANQAGYHRRPQQSLLPEVSAVRFAVGGPEAREDWRRARARCCEDSRQGTTSGRAEKQRSRIRSPFRDDTNSRSLDDRSRLGMTTHLRRANRHDWKSSPDAELSRWPLIGRGSTHIGGTPCKHSPSV